MPPLRPPCLLDSVFPDLLQRHLASLGLQGSPGACAYVNRAMHEHHMSASATEHMGTM